MYNKLDEPLYKSVSYQRYSQVYGKSLQNLKNFGIYYWPRFSFTSRSLNSCIELEDNENAEKQIILFEIYMTEDPTDKIIDEKLRVVTSIDTLTKDCKNKDD